jgi:hypothetical protein
MSFEDNRMLSPLGRISRGLFLLVLLSSLSGQWPGNRAWCAEQPIEPNVLLNKEKPIKDAELTLAQASMCESVQNLKAINEALTFSVSLGHVYCLSYFKPVLKPSVIFHRWYRRNELSTQVRLKVYPPHWATYSVIQLREEDKGPWHIEITDQNGKVFDVLRFSITD